MSSGCRQVSCMFILKLTRPKHLAVYKSPQIDMGYDISDYKDIDPKYGTLADVDELIAKLGQRDMKLMMDLVVNHTSNQVSLAKSRSESIKFLITR